MLVANRGEIAVRVCKALRELGIRSVAVYSDVDRNALHVSRADEAYGLDGNTSLDTYLRIDKILAVAARSGADAIHPGYGFLSENAAFAAACRDAGVVFVGPSPGAIARMGDKLQAREAARAAGVPLVPGSPGAVPDVDTALGVASELGYPVMLKAAAGGGGKGMRRLESAEELRGAFARTAEEARRAFANPELYLEKFIVDPRHIEIQVFGDQHGHYAALGERECTLQRRHQKVIEEAPSPLVTPELRAKMCATATSLAAAVGYLGAGTVEFVTDQAGNFYFLEMNTRLQVEHPVTELTTGLDLVHEQVRVAAGEQLSFLERLPLEPQGWAIECRIYAEDPRRDFLPCRGRILKLSIPYGPGVRNDFGIYEGYDVPVYYDPLLGKLAVWGPDRPHAIARMQRALHDLVIEGIRTNTAFHAWALDQPEFRQGNLDTGFIGRAFKPALLDPDPAELERFVTAAVIRAYELDRAPKLPRDHSSSRWALAGRGVGALDDRHAEGSLEA
ncbi:MAG TPA: acetyl-CoA carboxylase biotin carboxylase subunit [Candidatus Krumholzibacteria bacterium]|nr:acetyl-CoA carboxylase biotin carboxylase subunit [Candidatus Krumholzibacteria bacterium]